LADQTLLALGRRGEATEQARRAFELAGQLGYPFGEAAASGPLIDVALDAGDVDGAVRLARQANGLALNGRVRAEQVELDFSDDAGDARLTRLAGREVAGFLGLAGAGPVRAIPGEGGWCEDLEQERGEREIGLLRGKKPRRCLSRRPGRAGS
jgi:hypothetical protein